MTWEALDDLPAAAEAQRTEDEARETPIEQALDDTHDPGAVQDEQALDGAQKYGGKCKCSCFYWKGGGGWWSGYCTRREIKVSHGVTWCPAAEALTGRCDLRKQP